jgi:hypothetical protein
LGRETGLDGDSEERSKAKNEKYIIASRQHTQSIMIAFSSTKIKIFDL